MSAFDLSGQLDEIFETELDDAIMSNSAKKGKKKVTVASAVDGSSPMLKQNKRVSFDVPMVDDDEDIFGDSLNGSALDKMMREQCDKESADTSCPKTPGVRVIN